MALLVGRTGTRLAARPPPSALVAAAAAPAAVRTPPAPLLLLPPRSTTSTSTAPLPTFDKYRVVQRLEEHGLDRKQAEGIMAVLTEIIRESLATFSQQVVTRAEQEKTVYMYKADFAELKSELHMLEKNDFAILKGENERLEAELDKVRAQMREEISRMTGNLKLEMNLEKGRIRDETNVQESKIKDTENRIDTEISNVRTQLETLKFDIIKYIVGSVASMGALLMGYWRLVKSGG